jgi:branched-chain amino acid transport system substrate-binding protein
MHVSTRAKALSVSAAALLVLTACGSQDEGSSGDESSAAASSEPMKFGYVLPETGDLAFLGPPQIEAAKFAISQINDAGGVLGNDVPDIVSGDEAGDQAIASQSADRVLNSGVNVVIGAAASGMSLAIIDKVTGAGVAQCSGSNTAPTFTDYSDNGLYFRTAPSDALQGPVLGDVIVGDGYSNIAIVARADDYGKGLADATAAALEGSGATIALNETYDPKATNFDSVVQKVSSANPDAVVVIAFEEGTQILAGLIESGMTADKVGLYGADGLRNTDLGTLVSPNDPSVIDGMKGTAPASADNPDFVTSLEEFAPDLEQTQFAPQVYDCVTIMALAAEQAKSTDANVFKDAVNGITKDGEKCTTFADCKALIDEGTDIDYDGVSGPLDFTDAGEPGSATIEVYGFSNGGTFETISTETSEPAQ